MGVVLTVTALLAYYFLYALSFALLIRAIYSWFDPTMNSKIHTFVHSITEPFLAPIRSLLSKIRALEGLPIDLSFTVVYFLIIILQTVIRLYLL